MKIFALILSLLLLCGCAAKTAPAHNAPSAEEVFLQIKTSLGMPDTLRTADVSAEDLANFDGVDISPFKEGEIYACRQLLSVDLAEVIVAWAKEGREADALESLRERLRQLQSVSGRYPEQARAAADAVTGSLNSGKIVYMICAENAPEAEKVIQ